jgi:hypothetical protein
MARPRYTAAKRAREEKLKARREAKLARKHARTRGAVPNSTPPGSPSDTVSDQGQPLPEKPNPTS